jgi:hypothetical protein
MTNKFIFYLIFNIFKRNPIINNINDNNISNFIKKIDNCDKNDNLKLNNLIDTLYNYIKDDKNYDKIITDLNILKKNNDKINDIVFKIDNNDININNINNDINYLKNNIDNLKLIIDNINNDIKNNNYVEIINDIKLNIDNIIKNTTLINPSTNLIVSSIKTSTGDIQIQINNINDKLINLENNIKKKEI